MLNNDFDQSRLKKLTKRKKTNLILNSLIAIVVLLIIVVSVNIFFGDGQSVANEENTPAEQAKDEENASKSNSGENEAGDKVRTSEDEPAEEASAALEEEEEEEKEETTEESEESELVVTEGGSSPDVKETIVNPNWEPIGTSQTGEHAAVYDSNSVDWQEMLQAISYATGIDANNMTVWFLGNNGGPQKAAGTVSEKGGDTKYRVAIEWVENEGWMPVKVEVLNQ